MLWYTNILFLSLIGDHNYCRNPAGSRKSRPWCYTSKKKLTWQYCDISICSKKLQSQPKDSNDNKNNGNKKNSSNRRPTVNNRTERMLGDSAGDDMPAFEDKKNNSQRQNDNKSESGKKGNSRNKNSRKSNKRDSTTKGSKRESQRRQKPRRERRQNGNSDKASKLGKG